MKGQDLCLEVVDEEEEEEKKEEEEKEEEEEEEEEEDYDNGSHLVMAVQSLGEL
jgi:hypothetical protein